MMFDFNGTFINEITTYTKGGVNYMDKCDCGKGEWCPETGAAFRAYWRYDDVPYCPNCSSTDPMLNGCYCNDGGDTMGDLWQGWDVFTAAEYEEYIDELGWQALREAEQGYERWLEDGAGNFRLQFENDEDLRLHESLFPNGYGF